MLAEKKPDIAVLTEHWLKPFETEMLNLKDYATVSFYSRPNGYGGVIILVNKELQMYTSDIPSIQDCSIQGIIEMAAIKVTKQDLVLNVIGIYRPPSNENIENFNLAMDTLQNVILRTARSKTAICGDFNIDILSNNSKATTFIDLINVNQFHFSIDQPTRVTDTASTCIDNIIINFKEEIVNEMKTLNYDPLISDHLAQIIEFGYNKVKKLKKYPKTMARKINDTTMSHLNVMLLNENWENVISQNETNKAYNEFISTFMYHFDIYCPITLKELRPPQKNEYPESKKTKEYKDLLEMLNLSINNNIGDVPELKQIRKKIRKKYRNQVDKETKVTNGKRISYSNNVNKVTWKIIKELKDKEGTKTNGNIKLEQNGKIIEDPYKVANIFNDHYLNVPIEICSKLKKVNFNLNEMKSLQKSIYLKPTNEEEIRKIVRGLKNSKSAGTDDVSNIMIKKCIDSLAKPLVHIGNLMMKTGVYPEKTKECIVKPVHKRKSKLKADNFRPLTITSSFSKIFERMLLDRVEPFFRNNKLINDFQFGYKKGKSTIDAVTYAVDIIATAKSDKEIVIAIFLDLSKAFDCVRHDILLDIMYKNGVRGNAHELMKSFLNERKQCVEVQHSYTDLILKKIKSEMKTVKYNVPQGTVLGPFMFLIYINSIEETIRQLGGRSVLYVDDTNIIIRAPTLIEAEKAAKIIIDKVADLFTSLNLALNWDKTFAMIFNTNMTLDEISTQSGKIKVVKQVNFLGLTLTDDLKWKTHINSCISKLNKGIYTLSQSIQILNRSDSLLVYYANVHAHLNYGALIWGNPNCAINVTNTIFRKQKKAVRLLFYGPSLNRKTCKGLFKKFSILTFPSVHLYQCFKFVRLSNSTIVRDKHCYQTRNAKNVFRDHANNKSIFDHAAQMYNKLPKLFKDIDDNKKFLKTVKKWLINEELYSVKEFYEMKINI